MKTIVKKILKNTEFGRKYLDYRVIKKAAFQPGSQGPFLHSNKWGQKKTIDRVYETAFEQLFILLKSLSLKGDIFEFGVFQGYTARLFAKNIKNSL